MELKLYIFLSICSFTTAKSMCINTQGPRPQAGKDRGGSCPQEGACHGLWELLGVPPQSRKHTRYRKVSGLDCGLAGASFKGESRPKLPHWGCQGFAPDGLQTRANGLFAYL